MLQTYGFEYNSPQLVQRYILNQKQRPKVNDVYNTWCGVIFDIPHGSILDPLLLNILYVITFTTYFIAILQVWLMTMPFTQVYLTHLFPMHPFSTHLTVFWCFQGVEKGCIGNKWLNLDSVLNKQRKVRVLYFQWFRNNMKTNRTETTVQN